MGKFGKEVIHSIMNLVLSIHSTLIPDSIKLANSLFYAGCIGLFCPCYLFAKNAEFLGSGTLIGPCMIHLLLWGLINGVCCFLADCPLLGLPSCFISCYACNYRKMLRTKYNLPVCPFCFVCFLG